MLNPTATPRASKSLAGILAIMFCLLCGQKLQAQAAGTPYPTPKGCTNVATQGQDFWVAFGTNNSLPANQCYLAIQLNNGSSNAVTVTLTFTATGQSANISVPGNTNQLVDLSALTLTDGTTADMRQYIYQTATTTVTNSNTLHITSVGTISVVAFNTYQQTTDATIVLPTGIWGTDYYNFSYVNGINVHMIVANQDNTTVTITNFDGSPAGTATLNAGQAYYGIADTIAERTGTHIKTDKPVAYFMNTGLADVVVGAGDMLFQQLMPVDRYGQYFLVPNETQFNPDTSSQLSSNANNIVTVLAAQDSTVVNFTNALAYTDYRYTYHYAPTPVGYVSAGTPFNVLSGVAASSVSSLKLNAGQWTTVQIMGYNDSYCTIAANKPIGVAEYMQGGNSNVNQMGDPDICRISSVSNLVATAVIAPFIPPYPSPPNGGGSGLAFISRHYALIVSPTATKDSVLISRNGVSLGTLTAAAAAMPYDSGGRADGTMFLATSPTAWVDVPTPINGVLYSYIRYDFAMPVYTLDKVQSAIIVLDYGDMGSSFRITAPDFSSGGGILVTQVGIARTESYTFNSGNGGCLVNY